MKAGDEFWDGIAAKYAKSPISDMQAYEQTLERTQAYLKKSDQVLELGCGTGTTAIHLAPYVENVSASDFSEAMLEVARGRVALQGHDNIQFIKAAVAETPKGPFDVVLAFNLLHLIEDMDATLAEIYARLQPGGYFISKTTCRPDEGMGLHMGLMMVALPIMRFFGKAPFVRLHSIGDLEKRIKQAGFDIAETGNYPAKPPARFIVARK